MGSHTPPIRARLEVPVRVRRVEGDVERHVEVVAHVGVRDDDVGAVFVEELARDGRRGHVGLAGEAAVGLEAGRVGAGVGDAVVDWVGVVLLAVSQSASPSVSQVGW
jgi:hypothetical protein